MQTNNNLKPMFSGCVLMNETAIHDQAVMNALQSCSETNFEFKSIKPVSSPDNFPSFFIAESILEIVFVKT